MPSRRQRRRREKELRHEYEYVWEDAEGNVLESDEAPTNGTTKKSGSQAPRAARAGRRVQPPSWRRTLKRGLIFAPIMLGTIFLISPGLSPTAKILQAAFIVAIFIPFSYLLDGVFWRAQQRRAARDQAARKRG